MVRTDTGTCKIAGTDHICRLKVANTSQLLAMQYLVGPGSRLRLHWHKSAGQRKVISIGCAYSDQADLVALPSAAA